MDNVWGAFTGRILKRSFRFFESLAVHVLPVHFYSPIPDTRRLRRDTGIFDRKSHLLDVEMNEQNQIELLSEICPKYRDEYDRLPVDPINDLTDCYFSNEHYLGQAFLMYNKCFDVLWCASYMAAEHPDLLEKHFPHYDSSRIPTSLYIRRIA